MNLGYTILWLVVGALTGAILIFLGRKSGKREIEVLASGLFIAAFIYLVLALLTVSVLEWVLLDLGGVVLYGIFAWLAIHHQVQWLGVGWILHAGWDILHHASTFIPDVSPYWYATACISFDLLVGFYTLFFIYKNKKEEMATNDLIPSSEGI